LAIAHVESHFLDYPFDPEIGHAEYVLDALQAWGHRAFNALFDCRDAGNLLGSPKPCKSAALAQDPPSLNPSASWHANLPGVACGMSSRLLSG
jgi:hypothetical protein